MDKLNIEAISKDSGIGGMPLLGCEIARGIEKATDRIPLRLVGGKEVAIELPATMSEAAWKHMLKLLDAMKDGYVTEQPDNKDGKAVVDELNRLRRALEIIADDGLGGDDGEARKEMRATARMTLETRIQWTGGL